MLPARDTEHQVQAEEVHPCCLQGTRNIRCRLRRRIHVACKGRGGRPTTANCPTLILSTIRRTMEVTTTSPA